jgi:hypothetical protein
VYNIVVDRKRKRDQQFFPRKMEITEVENVEYNGPFFILPAQHQVDPSIHYLL